MVKANSARILAKKLLEELVVQGWPNRGGQ